LIETYIASNDVGGNAKNRKIADLALAWIVDQCHKNGLLEFHIDFLKSILEPTRNSPHESWKESTHDPFYAGFLPSKLWAFMGERVRQPGHEPLPKGWFPATKTSKYTTPTLFLRNQDSCTANRCPEPMNIYTTVCEKRRMKLFVPIFPSQPGTYLRVFCFMLMPSLGPPNLQRCFRL